MRLFDLHCDTIYECYFSNQTLFKNNLQLDLSRGLEYDAWGQAFAIWMPDTLRGEKAFQQCIKLLEFAKIQTEVNHDYIKLINNDRDLDNALDYHQCAAILTVEGGSALAGKLEYLDVLKNMGVKAMTLTWNGSNELGHGSASGCSEGLTKFGKSTVKRMEQLHILPDVSHLNEKGFWDVMDDTGDTVIASHSLSASVQEHPRNLTDEQFCAIRDKNGLVGLNLCEAHLGEQSFECIQRHLEHYLSLNGEMTVSLGCDLDGTTLPEEWGGIEIMQSIYQYLKSKNYDELLLDRLFFSNCYDFFKNLYQRFDNQ